MSGLFKAGGSWEQPPLTEEEQARVLETLLRETPKDYENEVVWKAPQVGLGPDADQISVHRKGHVTFPPRVSPAVAVAFVHRFRDAARKAAYRPEGWSMSGPVVVMSIGKVS